MDFIEKLFGLSPDGGSGAAEMLILLGLVLAVFAVGLALRGSLSQTIGTLLERLSKRK